MQQDSLTFKVTRAGRRYLFFLNMFNTADADKIRGYISENFAPSFLKENPAEKLVKWCLDIHKQTGKIAMHKVFFSEEYYIIVVIKSLKDDKLFLHKMKVEDKEPYKITELFHEEA